MDPRISNRLLETSESLSLYSAQPPSGVEEAIQYLQSYRWSEEEGVR